MEPHPDVPGGLEEAVRDRADGVTLAVKVVPGARRSRVAGVLGDRLKVQVAAPPEGGRANGAVCALLAEVLGVGVKAVRIASGETRPRKTIAIDGLDRATVLERLRGVGFRGVG